MSWDNATLSKVSEVFNGKTPSKKEQRDSGHPVLKIKDVSEDGLFKGGFESFVDHGLADKFSNKKLKLDDTLILNAAHNSDYVGSKQYRAEMDVVNSLPTGEWLIARADESQLVPRYLNYWFRSPQARFQIKQLVKGIHLYPKDVARLEIPLPPLAEQKRIAAILDKADAIRRKRQQAIQLADDFLRAVFLDMFGDPVTNPKGWEVVNLADIAKGKFQNGAYFPKEEYSDDGVEMVHMADAFYDVIQRGSLKRVNANATDIKKYGLTSDDIMISRRSLNYEGAAKPSLIPESKEPLIFESSMIRFTPDAAKVNKRYLFQYLSEPLVKDHFIRKFVTGATIKGISQKNLEQVRVLLPPLELQNSFIERVNAIEITLSNMRNYSGDSELFFNSLSQKAFAGKL